MATDTLLKIDSVDYSYDGSLWQLTNISLELHSGEIIGIIGPNGAGKSTLLKIAAGTIQPKAGNITLCGRELHDMSRREIAAQMGYLPQQVTPTFDYSVEEIVAMGRYCHLRGAGFLAHEDIKVIERCMSETETTAYRDRKMSHLSGGERQRVLLASVLAQQPQVLLLDEPTTGLDLHHQSSFFSLLSLLAKSGMAIAVVTHDLNLAGLFCDRLVLLERGLMVKDADVAEVLNQKVLESVYCGSILVGRHPQCDKPTVLPSAPGHALGSDTKADRQGGTGQ